MDLSTLTQMAPFAGGYATLQAQGLQNNQTSAETQRLQALIQQIQQQTQQQGQMNPLLLNQQRLQNQGMEAELPGKVADSRLKEVSTKLKEGTLDSDIESGIANNHSKTVAAQLSALENGGQILKNVGLMAKTTAGPGQGPLAVSQYLKSNGINEDHNLYKYAMQNASNPDVLINLGDQMIQHSSAYRQAMDVAAEHSAGQLAATKEQNKGRMAVANAEIEAGKYNKNKMAKDLEGQVQQQVVKAGGDAYKLYNIYNTASSIATQTGDTDAALRYATLAKANATAANAALNARRPPGVDVPAMVGLPATQGTDITGGGGGSPPPAVAPAGQAQTAPAAISQAAVKAWGKFEPDKYDYRIGPNGQLQRRPKG